MPEKPVSTSKEEVAVPKTVTTAELKKKIEEKKGK